MSIGTKFLAFALGSGAPRLHPIFQLMGREWKDALENGWQPCWSIFTNAYIKQACDQVTITNPEWHLDLYATNLGTYIAGMASNKMWWVLPVSRLSAAKGNADGAC